MSTALPFLSELSGGEYRFVGCKPGETPSEVARAADAPGEARQLADAATATVVQRAEVPTSCANEVVGTVQVCNRIAQVREQQGISQRTMSRRLGIDLKSYQALERPEADLRLSQLIALQVALEVPLIELLEDPQALSRPVAERAKMIKVMKTAAALRETPSNPRIERMVQTLCGQLVDLMPELAEVSSWPQYGSRRGSSAVGRVLAQQICTADLGFPE